MLLKRTHYYYYYYHYYYYSAQNGSESRFRDKCLFFFSVDLCYIFMVCSIASFDLYCAIVGG